MIKPIRFRRLLILVVLYSGLVVFLLTTDPQKLAIGWLILPFTWLFISLFLSFIYAIDFLTTSHRHSRRQSLIAALLAALPTGMLLLASVDQLTIKDALLIAGLAILGLFYVNKISLKQKNY